MPPAFRFLHQIIQIQFANSIQTLSTDIQDVAKTRGQNRHLNILFNASQDEKVILQSPTASTIVEVYPQSATLTTNYFGEYVAPEAWQDRLTYCLNKLDSLFELFEKVQAKPVYFSISNIARMSAGGEKPEKLRSAVKQALNIPDFMAENQSMFDFSMRVSREILPEDESTNAQTFSNSYVSWYQSRSYSGPPKEILNLWEMQLSEEGIEFKYDRNNKSGLMKGKRDWSFSDFREIANQTMRDLFNAFDPIDTRIKNFLV
jgi:hypothetical protein